MSVLLKKPQRIDCWVLGSLSALEGVRRRGSSCPSKATWAPSAYLKSWVTAGSGYWGEIFHFRRAVRWSGIRCHFSPKGLLFSFCPPKRKLCCPAFPRGPLNPLSPLSRVQQRKKELVRQKLRGGKRINPKASSTSVNISFQIRCSASTDFWCPCLAKIKLIIEITVWMWLRPLRPAVLIVNRHVIRS